MSSGGANRNAYSEDGINWTTGNSIGSDGWQSVCFGNGKFVAVALYGTNRNAYSEDGITWTASNSIDVNSEWYLVCYGNGKFVAVANDGTNNNAYSADGITWTNVNSLDASSGWQSVCYGEGPVDGITIGLNEDGKGELKVNGCVVSDLYSKTEVNDKLEDYYDKANPIIMGEGGGSKNILVAVAENGTKRNAYSTDGITWIAGNSIDASSKWSSVCYANADSGSGKFVAVASDGTNRNAYSSDGINWTAGNSLDISSKWISVCYGNGKFVAVAYDGTNRNAYSTDGINWTTGNSLDTTSNWQSVCYGNGKFVAVATISIKNNAYSDDGINWTNGNSLDTSSNWQSVCYGNGKFVAVAKGGTNLNAYSEDGINWTNGNSLDASDTWRSVCYGNGKFVAVGNDDFGISGTNRNAYSTDGINWTAGNSLDASSKWYSVCYGNGKFVAVGYGNVALAYSEDGINWTNGNSLDASSKWYSVCYCNTSTNGITLKINDDTFAGELWLNGTDLSTIDMKNYYTREEADAKFTAKVVSQTVTHDTVPEEDIANFHIGKPVYLSGNVYMNRGGSWVLSNGSPTDCICGVKTSGTYKEYVGIITNVDTKNNIVEFATHGDFYFTVDDSSKYKIGDAILYDGSIVSEDSAVSYKMLRMRVGVVSGIVDGNTIAIFRD